MSEELEARLRVYYSTHAIFHECADALAAGRAREESLVAELKVTRDVRDMWCEEYRKARAERDALRAAIYAHNAKVQSIIDRGEDQLGLVSRFLIDAARKEAP